MKFVSNENWDKLWLTFIGRCLAHTKSCIVKNLFIPENFNYRLIE